MLSKGLLRPILRFGTVSAVGLLPSGPLSAQAVPVATTGITVEQAAAQIRRNAPKWFAPNYLALLQAPLPNHVYPPVAPGLVIQRHETDNDPSGVVGILNPSGPTETGRSAFFQSLGTNGRACVTCHVPANAFGLSADNARQRYIATSGGDPLFDPVDGATCPSNVPANLTSRSPIDGHVGQAQPVLGGQLGILAVDSPRSPYYLLLNKGLIRIPLPVPANAEYAIQVVSDPYQCNTNPTYNQGSDPTTGAGTRIISVYRRPPMSANLKFKVESAANATPPGFPPIDPLTFAPLPTDPATGAIENGMIMWDGREPTLSSQAADATLGHAQATRAPTAAQVAEIVAFESSVYSAQASDRQAGNLSDGGALGGPSTLAAQTPGVLASPAAPEAIGLFNAWFPSYTNGNAKRASIYRGQQIFNTKTFNVTNVAGFNNATLLGLNNAVPQGLQEHCSTCHGQTAAGTDPLPLGQHDLGIGGDLSAISGVSPSSDLPIFRLTCKAGFETPFNGSVVLTNDPGKALITGKCADIGRFTTPQLRGLAARAPYFSDGSAGTLNDVVAFYNRRFGIGLSAQDQADLANFLGSL